MFEDRVEAGRRLGDRLRDRHEHEVVVLGLPRGGVPVAAQVAATLAAPLDVVVVRKLGMPDQPELAMGAVGEGGVRLLDEDLVRRAGVRSETVAAVEQRERAELARRVHRLRRGSPPLDLTGRTAIVVDDGMATGATARVACTVARHRGAARVVLAVPVAPAESVALVREADDVVCLDTPHPFHAVGMHYRDFSPVTEEGVARTLARRGRTGRPGVDVEVTMPVDGVRLAGRLRVPGAARGLVLFAHGSGSSRLSPRNRYVADELHRAGLGTLLFDLLTDEEARDRAHVFDVDLLTRRLVAVTGWVTSHPAALGLRIGYFGASTGAAAALGAATVTDVPVSAVVSRGGRPDLVGARLARVTAPTMLVVGGADTQVLALNRAAQALLRCENRLEVVPGATHLFEEAGTLRTVAELAAGWFARHLGAPAPAVAGEAR